MLPKKTSLAIATFGALMLLLVAVNFARPITPATVVDFKPRVPAAAPEELKTRLVIVPANKDHTKVTNSGPYLFNDQERLKVFYQALWRTEAKAPGAVTRVLHYGDSPVTADSITADVRSLLQERFGDAGHGFILIARPWAWYGHRGMDLQARGWDIEAATQNWARDGYHGLGGVSFRGEPGASSRIIVKEEHSHMEVQYLQQPGGGTLAVRAAGKTLAEVDTAGATKQPGFQTVDLPAGAKYVDLLVERSTVRLFGVSFDRDGPGVIYNSLGLNGGQVQCILRTFAKNQWAEQMQHQNPDLVILNYGTNESVYAEYIEHGYAGELREVIGRIKAAVPHASVLIMSPMDRGKRESISGPIVTVPILPRIVQIQHRIADETGCAFFNTFQAMGGAGTMARWYEGQPRLVAADFTHPSPDGARKVGVLLYDALESGFRQFKANQQEQLARQAQPGAKQ